MLGFGVASRQRAGQLEGGLAQASAQGCHVAAKRLNLSIPDVVVNIEFERVLPGCTHGR